MTDETTVMRGVAQLFLTTLFFVSLSSSVRAAAIPPLKCVTFNLLHGGVLSGLVGDAQDLDRRLDMVVEDLRVLEADIVGLQEASTSKGRGNVAERLAVQLGFHYVYAPAGFRFFSNEYVNALIAWVMNFTEGPAILSRFPITTWKVYDLPRCGRFTDPRVLLFAEVQIPWGRVLVCSTHISGDPCQAKRVAELIHELRGQFPVLLMGDFNALEDSSALAVLRQEAGLIDTFRELNPTVPGFTVWQQVSASVPTVHRRVDYLFLLPGTEFPERVRSSRVVLNTPRTLADGRTLWPSDHYGVLSEIELGPPSR